MVVISCCTPQIDLPELIHRIQSLLPAKEAARTCILSKSWLHAWSTIPTLRFPCQSLTSYNKLIDSTLVRYHRDNLPIQCFDLVFDIRDQQSVSLANKWIFGVASKSALKELFLSIWVEIDSFTLPDEIFSSANLHEIKISAMINPLCIPHNRVILCVSLRVLELTFLYISEDALHNLLSTCSLLEKINLCWCVGFKTIKLKNLRCLRELEISSIEDNDILEIDDVPSLGFFRYTDYLNKPLPFNMDSLGSVTHLDISGVVLDNAFFNMIKSNFPLLESLSLVIISRGLESIVITSLPLKRLTLQFWVDIMTIDVQVYAPKLLFFFYAGRETVPSLSFPIIAPEEIKLRLNLKKTIDVSFLINKRKHIRLSSKFDIDIEDSSHHALVSSKTKVDDLRRRVSFPVTNVQQLSVTTFSDERPRKRALFFDAFFSICHPSYVKLKGNKCFTKMMVKEMMKKKTTDLKDVAFKNPRNGKWEHLTKSSTSLLADVNVDFKLNWLSHDGPSGPEMNRNRSGV
ncbi:putative F-box/LRR-repeat protein isoform X2 [Tanacetum coccineum]